MGTPIFNPNRASEARGSRPNPEPSRPLKRMLNGGTDVEYTGQICAGDILTPTNHVSAIEERQGRLGEMLITTSKTVYKNETGETVAIVTGTGIRY